MSAPPVVPARPARRTRRVAPGLALGLASGLASATVAVAVLGLASVLVGCGVDRPTTGQKPPSLVTPTVLWHGAEGTPDWSAFVGKVVYAQFGFLRCGPCASTKSHLARWQEAYGDRGLQVVEVEFGRATPLEDLRTHLERKPPPYPVAYDGDGSLAGRFGVASFPTAVLVDRNGRVVWQGHPTDGLGKVEERILAALNRP